MRLTTEQAKIIRRTTHQRFGQEARVWLFGSRTDDNARGGDIDLLIQTPKRLENAFRESIGIETDLQIALGDQKIDILLLQPGSQPTPIHQIAKNTGVEL
ncbi:MAG: nucleotidyltransferase domain-containing protein [Rhodocyclaceae bacterium]|nr:nucleotidyltransferase domain-containing protein [Rhodocyclaceae bacterium]